jgi:WD40 repeat protein
MSQSNRSPWPLVFVLVLLMAGGVVGGLARKWSRIAKPPAQGTAFAGSGAQIQKTAAESRGPQVWVVAIGIDQYGDDAIPSCHGASRDARAVGEWFAKTAGWGVRNVLRLDDLGQPEPGTDPEQVTDLLPTKANLEWAFTEWLGTRVKPDDLVVVMFVGQAVALPPGPNDLPGSPGRQYLLPSDARAAQWDKTGWRLDEAIDEIAARGKNPIVCWLDTSVFGRGRRVDREQNFLPSATPMLQTLVRWPGVTAWLAADGQPAAEAAKVGDHSPFTAALLGALGTPDRPNNLHACLNLLNQDQAVTRQRFRTLGGFEPTLSLWTAKIHQASLAKREILLQRGHAGGISAVAITADGTKMITGAQDSTLKVWTVADRRVLRALAYHIVGLTSLSLSPNGALLASGDGAGWLRLWDLAQQREIPTGPPHDRGVERVALLPDGERFVSLDMDGKSWIWGTADPINQVKPLSRKSTGIASASRVGPLAFALAEDDGKIQLHAPDGKMVAALDGPGGAVTCRRLAFDGNTLLAGNDEGKVLAWHLATSKEVLRVSLGAAIDAVALGPAGDLFIASGLAVHGYKPGEKNEFAALEIAAPANLVAASPDGRWLAACTATGTLHVWKRNDAAAFEPFALEGAEGTGLLTTTFAFAPSSRKLVSGDQDGGLRTWDLPDGNQRPRILPRRGQIATLSISDDARYLLQVSQDWQAQVWDLKDGRGLARIEGKWTAGVLAPDGATAYLTTKEGGEVVAVDRATGWRLDIRFARPKAQEGGAETTHKFGKLAVSRDGKWIAAASAEGVPACVWEAATGKVVQTIRGHENPSPITAIGFSADGVEVLTASEDGTAKVWDRTQADPEKPLATFAMTDEAHGDPVPISAAALAPTRPRRVVTGAINGQILLWEEGKEKPIDLGSLERSVLALAFTPDGRWLAAAGADKSVWLWQTSRPRQRIRLEPVPQHTEQVNALVGWPTSTLIASGSDDTTIKLWSLDERKLLGTLSAEQGTTDWVAYTPEGLFDSSVGGEGQVTWLDHREILSFDQVAERFRVFKLTDSLRQGIRPKAPDFPRDPPPRLSIDAPARPAQKERVVPLTISLSEPGLANLRLYQNGVPVQTEVDLGVKPGTRRLSAQVRLRHGLNRFYVMASRPGSIDVEGRSPVVEVRYDGPDTPAQLHVIALGVSKYKKADRSLQFADRDAEQIAEFLHKKGLGDLGTPGVRVVLTNEQISEDRVNEAFAQVRDRVKGRPEDTVVVFMAGHADTLDNRFYLLLPSFPFRDAPNGAGAAAPPPFALGADATLGYTAVYRNIARLNALQRLVMIDACQAEAIGDDPGVRQIQKLIDGGAQRAKTAYLLAARRGEPANEQAALQHGLMTYTLLRGMGDSNLESIPGLSIFDDLPNADRDKDGKVTTDELRWYADQAIPKLASNFPLLVQRAGAGPIRPTANLQQNPRIQAAGASFPLVEVTETSSFHKEALGSRLEPESRGESAK